ncbi:MAG: hypothetical protein NT069_08735 [Planctomycetota bacterium]|nr:hypothetical protein [Planctomycetota bacterium]
MSVSTVQEELREFVEQLFDQAGGMADWSADADFGSALLPGEIASKLGWPNEEFGLAWQARPGALCVGLAGEFLDQAGQILQVAVPREGAFQAPSKYLRTDAMQEAIDDAFGWHNARVRVRGSEPVEVEYHIWTFQALLRSEECWEGQVSITLNSRSRAEIAPIDPLRAFFSLDPCAPGDIPAADTLAVAARRIQTVVPRAAAEFLARMDTRLGRDQKRLREYYNALLRETKTPSSRAKSPVDPTQIEARERAVKLELRRKLGELDERYAIDASLTPIVLIRLKAQSLAVTLDVQRKQAHRDYTAYWNAFHKTFEPLECSRCGGPGYSFSFTNDDVAAVCTECAG